MKCNNLNYKAMALFLLFLIPLSIENSPKSSKSSNQTSHDAHFECSHSKNSELNDLLEKLNDQKNLIKNNIDLLKNLGKGPEKNIKEGEGFLKNIENLIKSLKMISSSNKKINSEKRKVLESRSKLKKKIEKIMKYRRDKGLDLMLMILKNLKNPTLKNLISSLRNKIRSHRVKYKYTPKNKPKSQRQTPSISEPSRDTLNSSQSSRDTLNSSQPSRNTMFSSFLSKMTTVRTEPPKQSSPDGKQNVGSIGNIPNSGFQPEMIMKAVISAFLTSLPPQMCYKKKESGKLPSVCPKGYFFDYKLEACVESCQNNFNYHLASCWSTCPNGTKDCGGFCGNSCSDTTDWTAKINYVPSHITSTNNDVKCAKGSYKSCNLCFKDCKKIGLLNCDPHRCASSLAACQDRDHSVSNKFQRAVLSLVTKIYKMGSNKTDAKKTTDKKNKKSFFRKLSKYLSDKDSLKKEIFDTFKRIESSKSTFKNFLDKVMNHATKDIPGEFHSYVRTVSQTVSKDWIKSVIKGVASPNYAKKLGLKESRNFEFCNLNILEQQNCALSIFKFVEKMGPLELPTLFSEFLKPVCDI
jgi:hypothetical protein